MKREQSLIYICQLIVRIFTKCPYYNFKGIGNSFPRIFLVTSHLASYYVIFHVLNHTPNGIILHT